MKKFRSPVIAVLVLAAGVVCYHLFTSQPKQDAENRPEHGTEQQQLTTLDLVGSSSQSQTAQTPTFPEQSDVPPTPGRPSPSTESEYAPPRTKDPKLSTFVDRNATGRVTADMTNRFPRVHYKEDVAAVMGVLYDTGDNDTVRNEAANLLRRSDHKQLSDDLTKILNNPKEGPRFRSWCIQHLWSNVRKADKEETDKIRKTILGG